MPAPSSLRSLPSPLHDSRKNKNFKHESYVLQAQITDTLSRIYVSDSPNGSGCPPLRSSQSLRRDGMVTFLSVFKTNLIVNATRAMAIGLCQPEAVCHIQQNRYLCCGTVRHCGLRSWDSVEGLRGGMIVI